MEYLRTTHVIFIIISRIKNAFPTYTNFLKMRGGVEGWGGGEERVKNALSKSYSKFCLRLLKSNSNVDSKSTSLMAVQLSSKKNSITEDRNVKFRGGFKIRKSIIDLRSTSSVSFRVA